MVNKRRNLEAFFKYFDRYSKPVTLTYRQKGSFETSCGGICSIISFFILGWWLATEIISKFIIQPGYDISESQSLTQNSDLTFPTYDISGRQFFITYKMSIDGGTISDEDLLDYFTPVWIQYRYNSDLNETEPTFHFATPCTNVSYINNDELTNQTLNEIKGQYCADRGDVFLQGGDRKGTNLF